MCSPLCLLGAGHISLTYLAYRWRNRKAARCYFAYRWRRLYVIKVLEGMIYTPLRPLRKIHPPPISEIVLDKQTNPPSISEIHGQQRTNGASVFLASHGQPLECFVAFHDEAVDFALAQLTQPFVWIRAGERAGLQE